MLQCSRCRSHNPQADEASRSTDTIRNFCKLLLTKHLPNYESKLITGMKEIDPNPLVSRLTAVTRRQSPRRRRNGEETCECVASCNVGPGLLGRGDIIPDSCNRGVRLECNLHSRAKVQAQAPCRSIIIRRTLVFIHLTPPT